VKGFLWLHAWAAVGNEFPVQNKAGAKLFSVRMADGNDDHVVLVIESKHQSQRIDVTRDKSAAVKVAGVEYQIDYPSAMVAAAGNPAPTTPKAMLIVSTQQP